MNDLLLEPASRQRVSLTRVALGVVVSLFVLSHLVDLAGGLAIAAAALAYARVRRWPKVLLRYYFRAHRLLLPTSAFVAGVGAQDALVFMGEPILALGASFVAAGALAVLILIFERKIMKDIFDLVPVEQHDQLDGFLSGHAPPGQRANFTQLDPVKVEKELMDRVIGQDATIRECVQVAFRRARLARPQKPIMTVLFVGSTGAGKTELAKALADVLFAGRLVRVDCNELSAEHSVQRLIGAPPGYVGAEQGGQLCRDIGRLGTGVLLLDEVEKSHSVVLKTLMSLLDEARLTEQSTGHVYDASGFLIVLTSNARQEEIGQIAVTTTEPVERCRKVKDELKSGGFLPEVLARLDAIFPFAPLSRRAMTTIVGRFLMGFASDVGVKIASVDVGLLIDLVTKAERLRDYGVREVVRAVESAVVDQLLDLKDRGVASVDIRIADGVVDIKPAMVAVTATG